MCAENQTQSSEEQAQLLAAAVSLAFGINSKYGLGSI